MEMGTGPVFVGVYITDYNGVSMTLGYKRYSGDWHVEEGIY
jgi:hypothetical protein